MAVVPKPRASTRGKAAARPPTEEPPSNLWALIFAVVDSNQRTRNSIQLGILAIIGGCVIVYTLVAAAKGVHVHAVHLRVLVPGNVLGALAGGTLTFAVTVLKRRAARRRSRVPADQSTTAPSPDRSHTLAPPEGTPSQSL